MGFVKFKNSKAKADSETGLGTNSNLSGGRFFQKDGTPNMQVRGMHFFERLNVFHALLTMPNWKFILLIFGSFSAINIVFACIYLWIGLDKLNGMIAHTASEKFAEAFFFSTQTFTTVGYGRINPIGLAASATASIEALIGLMGFALITGLLYGRFSRPKAYLRYSKNMLMSPFKDGVALMFRVVPFTKNYLVNVEAKMTLAIKIEENAVSKTAFYNMNLDISRANTLTANWTIVHPINQDSPLYGLSETDIQNGNAEILIFITGFDESFSNTVISRASYVANEIVYGAKFVPMYHPNESKTSTVLELDLLDVYEKVNLPALT